MYGKVPGAAERSTIAVSRWMRVTALSRVYDTETLLGAFGTGVKSASRTTDSTEDGEPSGFSATTYRVIVVRGARTTSVPSRRSPIRVNWSTAIVSRPSITT